MTDVPTLLAEFVDELNAGSVPEVDAYMSRAEGLEARKELGAAIEGVLAIGGADVRWPRDAVTGEVVAVELAQLTGIAGSAADFRAACARVDLTRTQVAERLMQRSGLEQTEPNRQRFLQWIEMFESGVKSLGAIGANARAVIDEVLGHDSASRFAVAYRADEDHAGIAPALDAVADELLDGFEPLPSVSEPSPVDKWFGE